MFIESISLGSRAENFVLDQNPRKYVSPLPLFLPFSCSSRAPCCQLRSTFNGTAWQTPLHVVLVVVDLACLEVSSYTKHDYSQLKLCTLIISLQPLRRSTTLASPWYELNSKLERYSAGYTNGFVYRGIDNEIESGQRDRNATNCPTRELSTPRRQLRKISS